MKKIVFLIALFAAVLYAAPMGNINDISKTLTVKNDYWSCSFIAGSMFPGDFVFKNGTRAGAILFRDTAVCDGMEFYLFEERRSNCRILVNTANEFAVEFTGRYWRNVSPLIKPLQGVDVTCRYEFKKNSPQMKMIFTYSMSNNAEINFKSFFNIGWYYRNPFTAAFADGRKVELKKNLHISNCQNVSFANNSFAVQLDSENVFVSLPRTKSIIVCELGATGEKSSAKHKFTKQATLSLLQKIAF
ncbi:MAG: hypothetical protein IKB77_01100 [Lentisphaeria bacterium]|nr:hypothetical protein [Lentisphaeria bacterium]